MVKKIYLLKEVNEYNNILGVFNDEYLARQARKAYKAINVITSIEEQQLKTNLGQVFNNENYYELIDKILLDTNKTAKRTLLDDDTLAGYTIDLDTIEDCNNLLQKIQLVSCLKNDQEINIKTEGAEGNIIDIIIEVEEYDQPIKIRCDVDDLGFYY